MVNSICIQVVFANLQQHTILPCRRMIGRFSDPSYVSAPEEELAIQPTISGDRLPYFGSSAPVLHQWVFPPLHVATQAQSTLLRGSRHYIGSPFDNLNFPRVSSSSRHPTTPAIHHLRMSRFAELYAASRAAEHIVPTAASSSTVPAPMQIKRPLPDERDIGSSGNHPEGSSSQKKARAAIATACDRCRKSQSSRLTTIMR
jgi:hypothetical protein